MSYQDIEEKKYPTDEEESVLKLFTDNPDEAISFDDMADRLNWDEDKLSDVLKSIEVKGFLSQGPGEEPPIPQSFDECRYHIMCVMKTLEDLQEKGIVKLKFAIVHKDMKKLNAYASEHGWKRPTGQDLNTIVHSMLHEGTLEFTEKGKSVGENLFETKE